MTIKNAFILVCLAGCDLGPRVADPPDAPLPPDAPPNDSGFVNILPPGTAVPGIDTNAELMLQIRINDGLADNNMGLVKRSPGKAGGVPVLYWNFGPTPIEGTIAVAAPLYVLGRLEDTTFTPLTDHPRLIDTIPGDTRYSPMRRVINVPVTEKYKGERITSLAALSEAIEVGLVGDPVPDGTWVNLPVVLPGTQLEVDTAVNIDATQVYGRGYIVDVFELGTSLGRQPLRFGFMPVGQASRLLSGVQEGTPPALPTTPDAVPVFQFAIPTAPPTTTPNYSPIATDVNVRLADGVTPSTITSDAELFRRNATGVMTGYHPAAVADFEVTTVVNNLQIQFAVGSP